MTWLIAWSLFSLIGGAEAASPAPHPSASATAAATAPSKAASAAEAPVKLYFEAFRDGDLAKLKQAITVRLLNEVGEDDWKRNLHDHVDKYKSAHFEIMKTQLKKSSGVAGLKLSFDKGFETIGLKLLREKSGTWKVDDILGDYDPQGE